MPVKDKLLIKDKLTLGGAKALNAIGRACNASKEGVCDYSSLCRNGGSVGATNHLREQGYVTKSIVNGFAEWRLTDKGITTYNQNKR